jgi:hypothetical protein
LAKDIGEVRAIALTLFVLSGAGAVFLVISQAPWVGSTLASASIAMWLAIEVGPLGMDPPQGWRSGLLRLLGLKSAKARFSGVQRLMIDLGMFLPWLLAASYLTLALGREGFVILWWFVLLTPITVTSYFSKHEQRLMNAYRDQVMWLDLHTEEIGEIAKGAAPNRWWPPAAPFEASSQANEPTSP